MKIIKYYPTDLIDPLKCTFAVENTYPAKCIRFQEPITFFSLPGELRNQIYNLYFARDIYDMDLGWEPINQWIEYKMPTYFEILLANRQIYKETRSIARYEYRRQLRLQPHVYKIEINLPEALQSPRKWHLKPDVAWAPKCRNVFDLAKLQLPIIGLTMYNCYDQRIKERLQNLRTFFFELVKALQEQGATRNIQVHLPDYNFAERYWKYIFLAVEPLSQLRDSCDVALLAIQMEFVVAFRSYQRSRGWHLKISTYSGAKRSGVKVLDSKFDGLFVHQFVLSEKLAHEAGIEPCRTLRRARAYHARLKQQEFYRNGA